MRLGLFELPQPSVLPHLAEAQCICNEAYSLVYPHNDFVFIKMVQHYTCTCLNTSVIKSYIYDRSVVNKYDTIH